VIIVHPILGWKEERDSGKKLGEKMINVMSDLMEKEKKDKKKMM